MKYLTLIIAIVALAGCQHLKKTTPHKEKQGTMENKAEKQLRFSGEIIKIRNGNVIKMNSGSSIAIPLIAGCGVLPYKKFNDAKNKVALICSNGYFNSLYVIDLTSNKANLISQFNRKIKKYYYSFAWSGNNKLFFGYEDHVKLDSAYTSKHGEVLEYNFSSQHKRNIGCSVSKRVIANIDTSRIAVDAGMSSKYIYIVKKSNCATIQKIAYKNKTGITFSPSGNYYTYFNSKGSLFINSLKNDKDTLLAKAQVAPNNIRWSPDGRKLSFNEIANPKTGSTQVTIYFPATGKTIRAEKPSMVSRNVFKNAFWSPNGKLLIYQSSLTRFNGEIIQELHLYSVSGQKVINTFEVSRSNDGIIKLRGWIDNHHVLLSNYNKGLSIIKINDKYKFQKVKASKLPRRYSSYIALSFN